MDSIGSFFQKLPVILQKFWSDVVNGPQTLWQLTDGYPISRKILIGGAILAAVTILSLLIYYLRYSICCSSLICIAKCCSCLLFKNCILKEKCIYRGCFMMVNSLSSQCSYVITVS